MDRGRGRKKKSHVAKPKTLGVDLGRQPKTVRRQMRVEEGLFRDTLKWGDPTTQLLP